VAEVKALAKSRGIPEEAIDAALAANVQKPPVDAVAKIADFGEQGFRAACLLIETGHGGSYTDPVLAATYRPGMEKYLLELASRSEALPGWGRWAALRNLSLADTKEVRGYLLDRLVTERDAGLFMSVAQALSRLGESRGTEVVVRQLFRFEDGWGGVERHLLRSLSGMGGEDANRWLVAYLADRRAKHHLMAVLEIRKTDAGLAKTEAKKLLESGREFTTHEREWLERIGR
jgi:hypothetical protein